MDTYAYQDLSWSSAPESRFKTILVDIEWSWLSPVALDFLRFLEET